MLPPCLPARNSDCPLVFPSKPGVARGSWLDVPLRIFLLTFLSFVFVGNGLVRAEITITRDIEYAHVGERSLKLDLYQPSGKALAPLIVFIHGGAWRGGSKSDMPLGKLVAQGFCVASVDYRLSPEAPFPAQIFDLKAAIRFLRANGGKYGIDGHQIAVAGASAGGHLAALVGVTNGEKDLEGTEGDALEASSDVQAIVSLFGASDLQTILSQSTPQGLSMRVPALKLLLGGSPEEKFELARQASPVAHVDASDPPLLLIHGDADPQMPYEQAVELQKAYEKANRTVQLVTIPGGKHGGGAFFDDQRSQIMAGFLRQAAQGPDPKQAAAKVAAAPAYADVPFGPWPHQLLDVYLPAKAETPAPVLIWFGGLWLPGKHPADVNRFLPEGIAVVAVQSRTLNDGVNEHANPPVAYPMQDALRAVQFVRSHAAQWHIDLRRIAVGGGSQGALPALFVGCAGERAQPGADDPVEHESTLVTCVAAYRSQPSIDPHRMQEWVPGVAWGAPALGCSFDESLRKYDELTPFIRAWSPDALVNKGAAPVYFENNWALTQPEGVTEADYKVHSPAWALGFQKLAQQAGAVCSVKYPDHPTEKYRDIWDFIVQSLKAPTP